MLDYFNRYFFTLLITFNTEWCWMFVLFLELALFCWTCFYWTNQDQCRGWKANCSFPWGDESYAQGEVLQKCQPGGVMISILEKHWTGKRKVWFLCGGLPPTQVQPRSSSSHYWICPHGNESLLMTMRRRTVTEQLSFSTSNTSLTSGPGLDGQGNAGIRLGLHHRLPWQVS